MFVTGTSARASSGRDFLTVAYSATTGKKLWAARYSSRGNKSDMASAVATGPGGQRVFVTGQSAGDFATVAYSAATGKRLWVQRYQGPGGGADTPASLAVSPSGSELIVTGTAGMRGNPIDTSLVTIAYSVTAGLSCGSSASTGPQAAARRPMRWRSARAAAGCM